MKRVVIFNREWTPMDANRKRMMKALGGMTKLCGIGVLVIFLHGCESRILPPPPPPDFSDYEEPKPDLRAFRRAVDLVDRVDVFYVKRNQVDPDVTSHLRVEVRSREILDKLRALMQEREVTPSYTPAMMAVGPPWLVAYRGDTRLFVLHWKHKTKFQLIEAQDEAIRGSYEVPEDWYLRYLALCEKIRAGDGSQNGESGRETSLRRVRDNAPYLGGGASSRAVESGVKPPHSISEKCAGTARSTSEVLL